jgi:hypothetical protein
MVEKRIVCWWSDVKNVVFPKYLRPELNFMPWWVDKAL